MIEGKSKFIIILYCILTTKFDKKSMYNIRKEFPYEIEDSLRNMEHRQLEAVEVSAKHHKMIGESFHIAFDDIEFKSQCRNIFDEMNRNGRGNHELCYTQDHLSYSNLNQFLLRTIKNCIVRSMYSVFNQTYKNIEEKSEFKIIS